MLQLINAELLTDDIFKYLPILVCAMCSACIRAMMYVDIMQNKHISIIITYISDNRYHAQFDVV